MIGLLAGHLDVDLAVVAPARGVDLVDVLALAVAALAHHVVGDERSGAPGATEGVEPLVARLAGLQLHIHDGRPHDAVVLRVFLEAPGGVGVLTLGEPLRLGGEGTLYARQRTREPGYDK